jgi:hypothetical protein
MPFDQNQIKKIKSSNINYQEKKTFVLKRPYNLAIKRERKVFETILIQQLLQAQG